LSTAASSEAAAQALYFECQSLIYQRRAAAEDSLTVKQVGTTAKGTEKRREAQVSRVMNDADDQGHAAVLKLQAEYLVLTLEAPFAK
ncbi:hypothetical protein U2088_15575, partial [Listeria monocytogenes]|uniref:hypothetical protein n=1 Tax=Listeria monocytogenes TaxID=1639 RepID=UPI002FDBCB3D